jgi:O-methyltransferase domain/Dimerisation domain
MEQREMSNSHDQQADTAPPYAQLIDMARGLATARVVYTAAKLSLADRLAQGPKSADELAGPTGTHPPSLYRFMRALATLGILTESDNGRFGLTPLGEALKAGAPGSARATVLTTAGDWWMRGWGELMYSLETGRSGFAKSLGMPVFDWLAKHPEEASLFSETMIGLGQGQPEAVAACYDFSGFKTIVDVGGASGQMLTTILGRWSGPRGILFDLPHVVRDAPALIQSRGLMDRVTIQGGSFFEGVPSGADAYLLSRIIHDWNEEQCLTILTQCHRAMRPASRLLLIEMVLPPTGTPHPGKLLDLMMLVGPGGQERTEQEYAALLAKADLRLTRVVPTQSPVSVVEATIA